MKKFLAIMFAVALVASLFAGCAKAPAEALHEAPAAEDSARLNLYTWEGMFPQELLDGFEQETGVIINYVNFDTDETMLTRLQAEKGGAYDLVIADDYIIETVIAEGLAQKLDKEQIPNWSNINGVYQGQFYDPTDEYTVPFGAGVQTIVYNPNAISKVITGYGDLWNDPALVDSVGIIGNHRVINGMALKVLGESYNTEDTAVIEAAGQKLLELAPSIRFIKDDSLQDDLLAGEIDAAVMYTSQVTMAKLANPELKVVYPTEGIGFGIMAGFIPSQAPHADAAHKFMEYILRPENAVQYFEYLGYYCTTKAADDLISEDFREFLILPANFGGSMEMIQNVSADTEELHTKLWIEFKTACGQ